MTTTGTVNMNNQLFQPFSGGNHTEGSFEPSSDSSSSLVSMEKLPSELKKRLASFLSTRELLNLAETSKSVSSDLNIFMASSPLTDRASRKKKYRSIGDDQCFAVVIPKQQEEASVVDDHDDQAALHSMAFTCKVQKYGLHPRAKVSIVEQNLSPPLRQDPDYLRSIHHKSVDSSKMIGTTSTGENVSNNRLSLSFLVQPNKFYQLYVCTSGYDEDDNDNDKCDDDDDEDENDHDDHVQFSSMSLHRIGFSKKSTKSSQYKAYQFDVFDEPTRRRRHHIGGKK